MKNPPLPPIVYLVFTIVLFWGSNQIWAFITQPHQVNLADRQSSGERLLIREIDSSAKRKRSGIKLFAAGTMLEQLSTWVYQGYTT